MSRGFVKEDDQEAAPVIPPRAPLPAGVTNYVTPEGYQLLLQEKKNLENCHPANSADEESEQRRTRTVIEAKLRLLKERIASARIIHPGRQPKDQVRFGARVIISYLSEHRIQEFQIVGVDQASVKDQKIAFTAPIARALTGAYLGETVELHLGEETKRLKIQKITYE